MASNKHHVSRRSAIAHAAALLAVAACVVAMATVRVQAGQSTPSTPPDWSGVWALQGGTVFDRATVQPADGRAGDPGVRESPPYTAEYEAMYRKNIERVKQGTFADPISTCGTPAGFPRLMNLPDVYEFAVTPNAVWILTENGPNVMRIYTDGRKHPAPDELWGTYTGASIGHWEGDTLVFNTISLKGSKDNDVIVDRTGVMLSDASRVTTRMRKVDDMTLEAQIVVEDAKALTRPWNVTKRYRKQRAGTWAWDYACAENNRNPIAGSGKTLTLGPNGKPLDKVVD
jgi:hypothetical protein